MVDPTLCPHCDKQTRTIAGLCPNCGVAKPDGAVPVWVRPEARRTKSALLDIFGDLGPYIGVALVLAAISVVAGAVALVGVTVVVVGLAIVVLVCVLLAGLLGGLPLG